LSGPQGILEILGNGVEIKGTGYKEWWIDGQPLTEEQFNQWMGNWQA